MTKLIEFPAYSRGNFQNILDPDCCQGFFDTAFAEYLKLPYASSTALQKLLTHSPKHARQSLLNYDTEAKVLGRVVHTLVLEPYSFNLHFTEFAGERRSNAKRMEWNEILMSGKTPVRSTHLETAETKAAAVRKAFESQLARSPQHTEVTLVWNEGHVRCKARVDLLVIDDEPTLFDLKTTRDASRQAFERAILNYGMHIQAAWYLRGAKALGLKLNKRWRWLVIEDGSLECVEYEIDHDALEVGAEMCERALSVWSYCEEMVQWPGYAGGPIGLPPWKSVHHDEEQENDHS